MASKTNTTKKTTTKSTTTKKSGKQTNTKTAAKKTSTKGTTKNVGKTAGKKQDSSFVSGEITILVSLAICILLLISNFGVGGFIGDYVSSFLFGIFGLPAYIMPIIFFIGIAFVASNKSNSIAYIKVIAGVILTLMSCTFIQLISINYEKSRALLAYYKASSEGKNGGGILGGMFVKMLCPAVGVPGTFVIVIALIIISLVLITEKSFLRGVKRGSKRAYEAAKEDAMKRREAAISRKEEREQNRELKRRERQVSGVSFDTTLVQGKTEMKELVPPEPEARMPQIKGMTSEPMMEPAEKSIVEASPVIAPTKDMPLEEKLPLPFEEEMKPIVINRSVSENEFAQLSKSMGTDMEIMEEYAGEPMPEPKEPVLSDKKEKVDVAAEVADVEAVIEKERGIPKPVYQFPPLSLLKNGKRGGGDSDSYLRETAMKLQQTLKNFGVNVTITDVSCGPSVTRFELQPEQGVKVSKIVGLTDDIKLNLAAADIRIEAPIPGKAAVGIEVPNKENVAVMLRDLLETEEFKKHPSNIAFAAGRDIAGKAVVADIKKMPHVLIAGATGSGKSVCINTLIMSILYKANPEDVKLIMIDPKVVELSVYNGIPHLMIPVVTDPKKASGALNWAVVEMEKRYQLFAEYNVRDLAGYNEKVESIQDIEDDTKPKKLPQIVIIVDELADLMMVAPGEVETAICRLAQLARAAGIHLVLATQRPSVNVITGLIKANMPSRIAFSVSSGVDSRTIIDMNGAEKLLGKGDMLFYPQGYQKPIRVQGAFVSDKEVQSVVEFLVNHNGNVSYNEEVTNHVNSAASGVTVGISGATGTGDERDQYFVDAGRFIIEKEKASIGMLQRVFKIGFNRAARIMDQLAEAGVVGEEEGTKPRKVLMSMEEFEQYIEEYV